MRHILLALLPLIFLSCNRPSALAPIADSIPDTILAIDSLSNLQPADTLDDPRFVIVTQLDSTIRTDIRYATSNNFIGRPLQGYHRPLAILTRQAAEALARANAELRHQGLVFLIYDAYRPQRAVDDILQWSRNSADTLMRQQYYPRLTKLQIRQQGYISKHSKHTMGSTVDLTLFDLATQQPVDMGSPFDLFDPISHYSSPLITPQQQANRRLLRTIMSRHGFYPIECEWWHFTLRRQPYTQSFDFEIGQPHNSIAL